MCGIIGYSGHRPAVPLLIEGLHRLEYRGYDSSGVAFMQAGKLHVVRAAGRLSALEAKLAAEPSMFSTCGIGHTRWATHGAPEERNAHPHLARGGTLALVHNGIIENFQELRDELTASGCTFRSDTDTEVLACLIEEERKRASSLLEAFARALRRARGAYAVAMISPEEPETVYAARLSAPLLIGVGAGECFVASDIPAFLAYTRDVVFLEDGEIARVGRRKGREGGTDEARAWELFRLDSLAPIRREVTRIEWDMQAACKDGYKHFMLKEIMEQPRVIAECIAGRVSADPGRDEAEGVSLPELDGLAVPRRLRIVACGTSFNAGLWGARLLERFGGVPVAVEIASEFRYRDPLLEEGEAVLAISQSGETADTLAALRLAREKGCVTLGLCNGGGVFRRARGGCRAVYPGRAGNQRGLHQGHVQSDGGTAAARPVLGKTQREERGSRAACPSAGRCPRCWMESCLPCAKPQPALREPAREPAAFSISGADRPILWLWKARSSSRSFPTFMRKATRPGR